MEANRRPLEEDDGDVGEGLAVFTFDGCPEALLGGKGRLARYRSPLASMGVRPSPRRRRRLRAVADLAVEGEVTCPGCSIPGGRSCGVLDGLAEALTARGYSPDVGPCLDGADGLAAAGHGSTMEWVALGMSVMKARVPLVGVADDVFWSSGNLEGNSHLSPVGKPPLPAGGRTSS